MLLSMKISKQDFWRGTSDFYTYRHRLWESAFIRESWHGNLSIRLKTTKSTWLELYNVCLPNTTTQQNPFDPSLIKISPTSVILGDIHWHSQLWDPLQPPDSRDKIFERVLNNDFHIHNGSSAIMPSRITSNSSHPVISLCFNNWSAKTSWKLAELIGSSDHLSIVIKINHKIRYQSVIPRSARWRRNTVDWSCFTKEVESKMENLCKESNLSLCIAHFNNILTSTTTTDVGKLKLSKKSKPWMTLLVRAKIRIRNCLCQTVH